MEFSCVNIFIGKIGNTFFDVHEKITDGDEIKKLSIFSEIYLN